MHHWLGGVAATLLFLAVASQASAEADKPGAGALDPPDTVYRSGARDPDPGVERRLPVVAAYKGFLPVTADLSAKMPPVGNQEGAASSAAWAVAYAARGYYAGTIEGRDVKDPANLPSPGYVYRIAHQGGCEDGASISRVIEVLRRGVPTLADDPYKADCTAAPAPGAGAAQDFRAQGIRRIDVKRIDDIKGEIYRGNPVIVEYGVSLAFKRLRGDATFSEPNAEAAGPADMQFLTFVGYDERRQAFRAMNSWGTGWGDHGYAFLGYDDAKVRIAHAYVLDLATPRRRRGTAPEDAAKPAAPLTELSDLEQLPCGKVRVEAQGERRLLKGFVASEADLKQVGAMASTQPDLALGQIDVMPWPLCEALLTLAAPLDAADPPKISPSNVAPREGENLAIDIRAPGQPSQLYVSYLQADGSVLTLAQPAVPAKEPTGAGTILRFGDGKEGRPRFLIGPPYGHEMVVAIAAPTAVFDAALPTRQSAREYLTLLRRALLSRNTSEPAVAAAVAVLRTTAR